MVIVLHTITQEIQKLNITLKILDDPHQMMSENGMGLHVKGMGSKKAF